MRSATLVTTFTALASAFRAPPSAPARSALFASAPFKQPSAYGVGSGQMPGDIGFDPLNLAQSDLLIGSTDKARSSAAVLLDYRDAELRHGRIAMLAAVAWPLQEILSPVISRIIREPNLVAETAGRSPSVLNGGLEQSTIPLTVLAFFVAIAAIDFQSLKIKEEKGAMYIPGDFGFDPLRLTAGMSRDELFNVQTVEINNGRLAMVAITAMVLEEAISGIPVTAITPGLFQPWLPFGTGSVIDWLFTAGTRIAESQ